MRKLLKKVSNFVAKHPMIIATLLASVVVPAAIWAWGPSRPTFTMEKPANYVTFNSITNNPVIGGDERDFVGIREKGSSAAWTNSMKVESGKEYYVRLYVHNNAAENLNLVAENVTAKMNVPTNTSKSITLSGSVASSNASPTEVWDEATFTGTEDFNLAYVSGSARYENNVFGSGGVQLPDSIVTNTGAKLGYDKLDGKIPGCMQYAGYVTILVKPQFAEKPSISLEKTVRKSSDKTWTESVTVNPEEEVEFQIHAKNTGTAAIDNLVLRDVLPNGLTYVENSAVLYNTNNPSGTSAGNNLTKGSGINVGTYSPNGSAYVRLKAKVAKNNNLPVCGANTLTNLAQASDQNIVQNDTANVVVNKDCPKPKPAYSCDALTITKITRTKFEFNTNYTANNTEFTGVKYTVKDSDGKTVTDKTVNNGAKLTYENSNAGKYTVEATALTKDGNATSAKCKGSFEIAKEDKPGVSIQKTVNGQEKITIEANKDFTYEIVVRNTGNVDLKDVVVSDSAPNDVKFISTDKGTITDNKLTYTIPTLKVGASETIKITAQATKTGISQKNTACVDTPTIPGSPDDCDDANIEVPPEEPVVPVTPETPEQPTTPTTPSELPQTGPADIISAVLGVGSVTAALGYYIASRKQF